MMKLPELRAILREYKIKGYSHYTKKQLIELLKGKGLDVETGDDILFPSIYKAAYFIEGYGPESFLNAVRQDVTSLLRNNRRTRVKLILSCNMERVSMVSEIGTVVEPAAFHSNVEVNLEGVDVDELYTAMVDRALETMATFQMQGSNWTFRSIVSLEIHTVAYEPLRGSSYIPTPKALASPKKGVINMKNSDKCFLWCVARSLHPVVRDACRITKILRVQAEKDLNVSGIEYPVTLKAIDRVEKQNPSISVNVFVSNRNSSAQQVVNLLLITDGEQQHYCVIKDMSRLLAFQTSNKKVKHHFCLRCLNPFYSQESLNKHMEYCYSNDAVKIEMSEEGSTISFNNLNRSIRVPFIVYADFDPNKSYTKQYQKHTPSSFCYYIKCFDDKVYSNAPVTYTAKTDDEDVSQMFVDMLSADVKEINSRPPKKMIFGELEKAEFEKSTKCWICQDVFDDPSKKVRDHSHFTGKYRGAAHNSCNLKYKKPKFTPVVFHNLSGYDSHLFIKNLGASEGNINCIPNNEERYISFTKEVIVDSYTDKDGKEKDVKHKLRFIDSIKFMASSLDKLSGNPSKDCFADTSKYYNGEQLDLLLRKGVYPYEHMDSATRLSETKLPPKEAFYSRLSGDGISDADYKHAQNVWKQFGTIMTCTTNLMFCSWLMSLRTLEIMVLYSSRPSVGCSLEDNRGATSVAKGIRGGISMISHRYGKANNPYMGDKYNENDGFKWMSETELGSWYNHSCILEVDMEYPKELHDLHNDYPLAPESLKVGNINKLIPNLNNKEKYVVHYENLKLYESLGLKITKIHRGINLRAKANNEFEKDFFKLMNNSVFGKTMENIKSRVDIRLVNNAVKAKKLAAKPNFKHCNIFDENLVAIHMKKTRLVFNKPVYLGMCILDLSKTLMYDFHYNYMKQKYISEDCKLLFTDTDSLAYEVQTADFYKNIFSDVTTMENMVHTSNFPKTHPSGIEAGHNKKVVGMFKDEAGGEIIEEFVGLRAKFYSYKMLEGKEEGGSPTVVKKCKGVKKPVVKRSINFDDYKECLFTRREQLRKMNVIRSHGH
ncbi:hypothetical protein CAPTEDRAFT_213858 [Capitella teleta]|uniref:C2H2-type domain-containing protein n=1 Tax=Capitella teleta TaxID=283909 RepID=R7V4L8_CAPTE|nr:hypothetical protein CAPTEDRAFT_213858 [Capitella teleta]|eukprot:ELU13788.1 hypothetical protein CAPTEDRAFT_213858 [Capitella teleta]